MRQTVWQAVPRTAGPIWLCKGLVSEIAQSGSDQTMRFLFGLCLALGLPAFSVPAAAQPARPVPVPAPSIDLPDRTQASFGDWVVRCGMQRPQGQPASRACEMAMTMNDQRGQPLAQLVLGRPARGEPQRMLAQLPIEMRVDQPARLWIDPAATEALTLPFRLCSVSRGGCFAELESVPAPVVARMRARAENQGRLDFRDSAGRDIQILFSFRGFGQALDALAREPGG